MKKTGLLLLIGAMAAAACSTTSSNNTNMRGQNTNTGYTTNSETNAKPAMPANATNITPPNVNMPSLTGNSSNSGNSKSNSDTSHSNSNTKKP